jgi:SAM-dependent methyltransferase
MWRKVGSAVCLDFVEKVKFKIEYTSGNQMNNDIVARYSKFYRENGQINGRWPTEFLVRAILGSSYKLVQNEKFERALDLGFGDCRNLNLLRSIFLDVHGLEIAEEICEKARSEFQGCTFSVGRSHRTPYEDSFFDLIAAVHSIYYCQESSFEAILEECYRTLRPGGRFLFSVPKSSSYLVVDAKIHKHEYAVITNDPLKIRDGTRIKFFESMDTIQIILERLNFRGISIGSVEADWWGLKEHYWIVSAIR